ncbi:MAG: DUF4097 family beta strand repeat protein, partial [Xanthomonadales bacterium]|nr:DUF4097 domain-containing protein [Xanthomonadales bacterium]NIX13825.1 DUF4097 family beta strand repeat protein [Xanthomonadales bacterium]
MTKWLALFAILVSADAQAWNCKHERSLDEALDVDGSESLAIEAFAGDLEVTGISRSDEVRIRGRICASKKDWLDETRIETSGGDRARIGVDMPNMESSWSLFGGNRYAYVDLVLEVPEDLALEIRDTSGDITLENTTVASVEDSSGDIEISDARGALELRDTSGDVTLRGLAGDLTVLADSSGDLHGRDIDGAVTVLRDSSGDIR